MKIHTLLEMDFADTIRQPIDDYIQKYLTGIVEAVKNAQPFFNKSDGHHVLWRGVDGDELGHRVYVQRPRTDRNPRDTAPIIHAALNTALSQDVGYTYRSGAAFAVSEIGVAKEYGTAYVMLPHGNFDFCWSPVVDDATLYFSARNYFQFVHTNGSAALQEELDDVFEGERGSFASELNDVLTSVVEQNTEAKELFNQWFMQRYKEAEYTTDNFVGALGSRHEIMVKCAEYSLITDETISPEDMRFIGELIGKPEIVEDVGLKFTPINEAVYMIAKHLFGNKQ